MSSVTLTGNVSGTGVFTIATPNSSQNRTLDLPDETGTIATRTWIQSNGFAASGIFYENWQNVTANYTITSGKNAMSAGPITINTGVTVTIPTGSNWAIV